MKKQKNTPTSGTPNIFSRPAAPMAPPRPSEIERQVALSLYAQGQLEQSEAISRSLTQRYPQDGLGWKLLGAVLKRTGRAADALEPMQTAAKLMPMDWEAFNNLGALHDELGNRDFAEACYLRALELQPGFRDALQNLAELLRTQNRIDEALTFYRRKLAIDPHDGYSQHMVNMLTGENSERAPADYVSKVFDGYADTFENHLTHTLQYNVPMRLVENLLRLTAPPSEKWQVLDLGCGTGLVGDAIAPHARSITGVDLSARMIEKSRAKGVYQRLVCDDIVHMLGQEPSASADVILSADVFIYVGKLEAIISACSRVLRPGGHLAFSVETLPDDQGLDFRLEKSGRYSQSLTYLRRLSQAHGFQPLEHVPAPIRLEAETPVHGHLAIWRR
jgi:predicted TPR repeat methyltransferase